MENFAHYCQPIEKIHSNICSSLVLIVLQKLRFYEVEKSTSWLSFRSQLKKEQIDELMSQQTFSIIFTSLKLKTIFVSYREHDLS